MRIKLSDLKRVIREEVLREAVEPGVVTLSGPFEPCHADHGEEGGDAEIELPIGGPGALELLVLDGMSEEDAAESLTAGESVPLFVKYEEETLSWSKPERQTFTSPGASADVEMQLVPVCLVLDGQEYALTPADSAAIAATTTWKDIVTEREMMMAREAERVHGRRRR